jgi:type II secretory pathway component PulJ
MTTFSLDTDPQTSPAMEAAAHDQARRRGFTLVEIMAATGIMVAVILLVLSLTTNVLNTWNFSSAQLAQNYEARIALDFLSQDLEAAVFRSNGMAWMEVRYENLAGTPATDQTQLFFFSPVVDRPRKDNGGNTIAGDICAVAYLTEFQNPFTRGATASPSGDRPQFGLYRAVVDAENTFEEALSLKDYDGTTSSLLYSVWNGVALASDGATRITLNPLRENGTRSGGNVMTWITASANYLSANVADFKVIFYYDDGTTNTNGTKKIKALTSNDEADGTPIDFLVADGIYEGSNGGGGNYSAIPIDGHLVYADIKMTVLGDEGANMVANGSWGDTGLTWDNFLLAYGETFTRRVYIMSNPI